MKVCQKCGAFAEDGHSFCSVCGSKLIDEGAQYGEQAENTQYQPVQPPAQSQQPEQPQCQPVQYQPNYQSAQNRPQGQPYCQPQKTNGLAVAGFVLSFFGVFAILALIFSAVGKSQINRSNGTQGGGGLATAGLVLSIITLVLGLIIIIAAANCAACMSLSVL